MTEAIAAETAARSLIEALTPFELPAVILIGLPKTGQFIRVANGMSQANNRVIFTQEFISLLELMARQAEPEATRQAPLILQTDLRIKECPVCLGSGRNPAGSELSQEPCECCAGRGRVVS